MFNNYKLSEIYKYQYKLCNHLRIFVLNHQRTKNKYIITDNAIKRQIRVTYFNDYILQYVIS